MSEVKWVPFDFGWRLNKAANAQRWTCPHCGAADSLIVDMENSADIGFICSRGCSQGDVLKALGQEPSAIVYISGGGIFPPMAHMRKSITEKPRREEFEQYFIEHCANRSSDEATSPDSVKKAAKYGCVLLNGQYGVSLLPSFNPSILLLPDSFLHCAAAGKNYGCHEFPCGEPTWLCFNDKMQLEIKEALFVRSFTNYYELKYISGAFYDQNGYVDESQVRQNVYSSIEPFVGKNLSRTMSSLLEAIKAHTHVTLPLPDESKIYIADGKMVKFDLQTGDFAVQSDNYEASINRLPLKYDPDAECPCFSRYLRDLLYTDDLAALQEYMGYCLIPSTRSQTALFLKGEGGEGKSILTYVVNAVFGRSAANGHVSDLETKRFTTSLLENKLVYMDDDLNSEALRETGTLKMVITATTPILVERKGQQAHEANIYARLLCLGNSHISAAFDRTDGFYRRLLLLTCKPIPPDRVKDVFLGQKISAELPGIFNWMLCGLQRLIRNNFEFTRSARAQQELERKRMEENPMLQFVLDSDWITSDPAGCVTSRSLRAAFMSWCEANAVDPPAVKTISNEFAKLLPKHLAAKNDKNIFEQGKKCAGYKGCVLTQMARKCISSTYSYLSYAK